MTAHSAHAELSKRIGMRKQPTKAIANGVSLIDDTQANSDQSQLKIDNSISFLRQKI